MFYRKTLEQSVSFEVPARLKDKSFGMGTALLSIIRLSAGGESIQFRSRVRTRSFPNKKGGTVFEVSVERYIYWPIDIWPGIFFLVDPKQRLLATRPLNTEKMRHMAMAFIEAEDEVKQFIPENEFCLPGQVVKAIKKAKCQKLLAMIKDPY